jgi:hypothetical protein
LPSDRRLRRRACVNYGNSVDRARGVVDQIETAEGRAIAVRADVHDFDAIQRMTDQTATSLSWTDELSASPDLLAELDRVSCLPSQRPMGTTSPR